MDFRRALTGVFLFSSMIAFAQQQTALPDPRSLLMEVSEHQKQIDKIRENYTWTSQQTIEDLDSSGHVKKTGIEEREVFFVNGHPIDRLVQKNGKALDDHDSHKEMDRLSKLIKKAEKTPSHQSLEGGPQLSVGRMLDVMDVRNERRELYHGRSMIVFDFAGRRDAKAHGMEENISKKLQGTIWVDEADKQVAHLDVYFNDNFHMWGGMLASVQKGTNAHFEQSLINGEIWLPVGFDVTVQARVAMLKGLRQHYTERDQNFKRFQVDARQNKNAKVAEKP